MPELKLEIKLKTCGYDSKSFTITVSNTIKAADLKEVIYPYEFPYHFKQQGLLNWLSNKHICIKYNGRVLSDAEEDRTLFIIGGNHGDLYSYEYRGPAPYDSIREAEDLRCGDLRSTLVWLHVQNNISDRNKQHLPPEITTLIAHYTKPIPLFCE